MYSSINVFFNIFILFKTILYLKLYSKTKNKLPEKKLNHERFYLFNALMSSITFYFKLNFKMMYNEPQFYLNATFLLLTNKTNFCFFLTYTFDKIQKFLLLKFFAIFILKQDKQKY